MLYILNTLMFNIDIKIRKTVNFEKTNFNFIFFTRKLKEKY